MERATACESTVGGQIDRYSIVASNLESGGLQPQLDRGRQDAPRPPYQAF
jgi:hypothetical protein